MADTVTVTFSDFTDENQLYPIESERWYQWLNSQHKFRYSDTAGTMTCYKQERSGSLCWYGQKRRDGILRTQYLGKSEDLTAKVLHECCQVLNLPKAQWLTRDRKRATKSKAQEGKLNNSERMIFEREREQRMDLEQKLRQVSDLAQSLTTKCETLEAENKAKKSHIDSETFNLVIEILEDALTLKANAGGAIKSQIKTALSLLKSDN